MKQVSKASQLNKSVKQVSLASQVKQVGLASQVSNLPKSSQESEIKKVLVKQVQVKQVKSSKFKLSNLNQASEVMLDRDTAPRKRPSTRLSGKKKKKKKNLYSQTPYLNLRNPTPTTESRISSIMSGSPHPVISRNLSLSPCGATRGGRSPAKIK